VCTCRRQHHSRLVKQTPAYLTTMLLDYTPLQPLLLLGLLACHVVAPWAPVAAQTYDPRTKDWASVIAACKDVGAQEKRLMNFVIRTSFHDSLSVTNANCKSGCGAAGRPLLRLIRCLRLLALH
jgi:hypothetical protein